MKTANGAVSAKTVAELFLRRVAATPNTLAFQFPTPEGSWGGLTWRNVGLRVRAMASGLLELGLGREDRVAILSSTRVEWILADLAVLVAGGATTTIYPSNTAEECAFILEDSDSVLVFAEDEGQVDKLRAVKSRLPQVRQVITFEGPSSDDGWVLSLAELERRGAAREASNPGEVERIAGSVQPSSLATLIYTSGTTGRPKGVELTHDAWVFEGEGLASLGILSPEDHQYLWLPLSHSFGKVLEVAQLAIGFPTTVDGRIPQLVDNLAVIRPTFMAAAPRIFERVYNKVVATATEAGGTKLQIFRWALEVGKQASKQVQAGEAPKGLLALKLKIADKLVFSKLRARFGGRIRFFVSGSAPLSRDMAEFFHAAGILICEGYGLTESSAASFVNRPEAYRFGSVGHPIQGVKVKIAEDGEVLLGGRGIMRGYWKLPEATAEALTEDGWLCTGDIGELDERGFLRITDRKKDLIKTSGGKYIAPQKVESRLKALCPYLSHVLVHGDRRNFCTALVTLDEETILKFAAEHQLGTTEISALAQHPRVVAMVEEAVGFLNKELASYETIKKFAILEQDLTVDAGDLTASMKVKRKAVEKKHAALLDDFYRGSLQGF